MKNWFAKGVASDVNDLLSEMTEKMEELVLEKTTLEKEKAKVQDVLLNLDNLRGKKEDVAKVCT